MVPYPEGLVIRIVLTCLLLLPACLFAQDGAPAAEEVPVAGTDATTYVPPASLEALLAALPDASLPEKGQIINGLAAEGSPAAHRALRGLLNGLLYVRSSDRRIVAAEAEADPLRTTDVVGLDVRLGIAEELARELGPRFEPPELLRRLVAEEKLGRKSGEGFYVWSEES